MTARVGDRTCRGVGYFCLKLGGHKMDFSLCEFSKLDTNADTFQSKFLEISEGLQDYYHIFTDGSRMNSFVGAAAVGRDVTKSLRITSKASIFTAELVALNLSLDIIRRSKHKKFAIFSDSLSSLTAIHNRLFQTGYVQKFILTHNQLANSGKTIILCWIPSHVGIRGNERADEAAKSALSSTISYSGGFVLAILDSPIHIS